MSKPSTPNYTAAAGAFEPASAAQVSQHQRVPANNEPAINMPKFLRWVGSIFVMIAGGVFMFQGFHANDSIVRIWHFLGLATGLAGAGMLSTYVLKEVKGARTYLGLAALGLPVLASQLGALVFSLTGTAPAGMPEILVLTASNGAAITAIAAACLAVMVPVVWVTTAIFARRHAVVLSLTMFALNAMLLLPWRGLGAALALLAVALATIWIIDVKWLRDDVAIKNFEGRSIRAMLVVPLMIILGRQMFYAEGYVAASLLAFGVAAFCTFPRFRIWSNRDLTGVIYTFGVASAMFGWLLMWIGIKPYAASDFARIMGLGLPLVLIAQAAAHLAPFTSKALRAVASFLLACTTVLFYMEQSHAMAATLMMLLATGGITLAVMARDKINTVANGFLAAFGLLLLSANVVEYLSDHLWLTLALTGVTVIMVATIAESQNQRLQARMHTWRQQFRSLS